MESGWQPGGVNWRAEVCAYTEQMDDKGRRDKFEKRLLFHPYANCPVWTCNSENMSLPLTAERTIRVRIEPKPPKMLYKCSIDVSAKIIGYRI